MVRIDISLAAETLERPRALTDAYKTLLERHFSRAYPDVATHVSVTDTLHDDQVAVTGRPTAWNNMQLERQIGLEDMPRQWAFLENALAKRRA